MQMLEVRQGAVVRYTARFDHYSYANISFFTERRPGGDIPFHLSLRAETGRAVCNTRKGALWGREVAARVTLGRSAAVEIRLGAAGAEVFLDGQRVLRLPGLIGGRRFARTGRIVMFEYNGGIAPSDVAISLPRDETIPAPGTLALTRRLELVAQSPSAASGSHLLVGTPDGAVQAFPSLGTRARNGGQGGPVLLEFAFPGRVWRDLPEETALSLSIAGAADGPGPRRDLDRDGLAAHMNAILAEHDLRADPHAAMQLAEHLRFSGVAARLDRNARRAALQIAGHFRLQGFLGDALDVPACAALPVAPDPASDTAAEDEALVRSAARAAHGAFSRRMRAEPGRDRIALLWELADPLEQEDRAALVLALSEAFCAAGEARQLYRAARQMNLPVPVIIDQPWHDSAILPFLLLSGQGMAVARLLDRLDGEAGWVVTPAIDWTVRTALTDGMLDAPVREAIVKAAVGFLEREAVRYWGRSSCSALISMSVALLSEGALLPDAMRAAMPGALLAVHGGSRVFWNRLEAAMEQTQMPAELAASRQAFRALDAAARGEGDRGAVATALDTLGRAGLAVTPRLRRELLGPSGSAAHDPEPTDLAGAGLDPGEAAIRHLSFPQDPARGAALAPVAAAAMAGCYREVPRAPRFALQHAASRRCTALLARVAAGGFPPGTAETSEIADMLIALSDRHSGHVGIGLALALLRGLARGGALDAAELLAQRLADHLDAGVEGAPDAAMRLRRAPAVRMALAAFVPIAEHARGRADGTGLPLAGRLVELLGPVGDAPALPCLPVAGGRPGWPALTGGGAFFDTLVVVFSCRANLETRIPAMRSGWLGLLRKMGIPHIVVVGDGDGAQEGDVVALDAPDDYEGLPQKTLAAIEWVHARSDAAYMLKIDDDCFLDPAEFFHSQSYRKFDFYGRILRRSQGEMDRSWHTGKSRSPRGRFELDKSPEPSIYADGGSGYCLSRDAMGAALDAASSSEGQRLIRASFMEDKMLGDLLALRGITPAQEDYRVAIRRRPAPGIRPVSLWVNGFDASLAAPVKLVHLDGAEGQERACEMLQSPRLTPSKIWPSFQPVTLGYQSNALELVSDLRKVEALRAAPVAVVSCMRNEMFMLPHFLDHYRRQGVEAFAIADNLSDDGSLEFLADQPDVALFSVDTDYSLSHYGVAWQQALLSAFRVGRWSLVADADELAVWSAQGPDASLPALLEGPEFRTADAVRLFMLDMYPSGPLAEADFTSGPFVEAPHVDRDPFLTDWPGQGPYSNMPTWTSALRHRLIPGSRPDLFVAQKIALLRYHPAMRLSAGLHFAADVRLSQRELFFAHFKYNADFYRKAQAEVTRRQHFNDAEEYRKYLALASEGRERLYDPEISVPWTDCEFVTRRLR